MGPGGEGFRRDDRLSNAWEMRLACNALVRIHPRLVEYALFSNRSCRHAARKLASAVFNRSHGPKA